MADYDDDEELGRVEPTPSGLAHWLEEQYLGDDRFETIEIAEPGQLDGEAVRVRFICSDKTHFFVAVLEDDMIVRVGLATEDRAVSEHIENSALETGNSLTEFLEESMGAESELEHEVAHFHDDMFYFCSDISYQREVDLASSNLRDEVIYYLDGYITALYDYLESSEEE